MINLCLFSRPALLVLSWLFDHGNRLSQVCGWRAV